MVLHTEIVRCMRLNPETGAYECEQVYKPDAENLRGLYDFLDAFNVKEIKHTLRTYSNGVAVNTVFRDLIRYSVRKHNAKSPMNDT